MEKYIKTSSIYTIIAVVLGVFYREFTKFFKFTGETRLSVLHTHFFVLGMIMFLLFALLEKETNFSKEKHGSKFFMYYNIGLVMTGIMLFVRGIVDMFYTPETLSRGLDMSISGLAGVSHIILGFGIFYFFNSILRTFKK